MSDLNPYAAPSSAVEAMNEEATSETMELAGQGRRLANLVLDQVALQVLLMAFELLSGSAEAAGSRGGAAPIEWAAIPGMIAYYIVCEAAFGQTFGKLVTGTRVVDASGGSPSFAQILGRTLSRYVPFEVLSFLGSTTPVGWHDRWSGTRVIRVR